jgi:hypothetical protein
MILQQRLTSRSSRSLAVMIGFAQPAGLRGTWRSGRDIVLTAALLLPRSPFALLQVLPTFNPFAATDTGYSASRVR